MAIADMRRASAHPTKGTHPTLQEFLTFTLTTPRPTLRLALAAALPVETPNTPEAYSRFYCRVIANLGAPSDAHCRHAVGQAEPAVACAGPG